MATNQNNGQDSGNSAGRSAADVQPDYVFDGTSAAIVVPVGDALLSSEYSRSGPDLYLETPDGQIILVTNYFAQEIPPDLFTLAGSRITADVAAKLAGPRAPGQVAQDGDGSTLEEPIGTVDTAKGVVTVIRADGTQVTLVEGDPLYQGDTLVSGPDSAIGIIFADKSTMSMAANARIILDELVYDPQETASNSQVFNVIQGAFMFTSGAIGKANPEDVSVNTPVATIGIRGTKFGVSVDALDGTTNVTIFEGAVFVQNGAGNVLLTGIGETTLIPSYSLPPSDPKVLSLDEIQRIYGDAIGFHPVRQEIPDDHASVDDDLQSIADELDDIETAAGGNQQGGEGANTEFGEIGNQGIGESGLGGTPLGGGTGAGTSGETLLAGGGSTGSGGEEGGGGTGVGGGITVEELEISSGVLGEDGITRFSSPPLSSGTNYTVSAPSGGGIHQLGLDASGLGGGSSTLSLQSGSTPDNVNPENNSVSLSSSDGMNLTINGFEELAITLGGGADSIDIGNLDGTSIIPDTITIFAGDGADVITTSDGTTGTKLVVDAGDGDDQVTGSELGDFISGGAGSDIIQGGGGDDSVSGGTGDDILVGATGNDILEGNEDNDILTGNAGDDTLRGGSGNDFLEGGSGSDVVEGGEGDDRAVFVVGQEQTDGVNDAYDGGADTDTIVINFDSEALENPAYRQAIADIQTMLGGAASGAPEEFDTAPFEALGVNVQNFELVELDGPAFALPFETSPSGDEDGTIALNIALTEVLPGNTVTVTIGNLNGATLSAGTDNGDGTFTLTVAQLDGLTVTPVADSGENLNLSVTVITEDGLGNTESVSDTVDVLVSAVADAPDVISGDVSGDEDTAIALNLSAIAVDADESEVVSAITLTGFEPGTTFSAGEIIEGVLHLAASDLPGLTLTPPADFSGDMELTVAATSTDTDPDTGETDTATTTQSFVVSVAGVADAPELTAPDASGSEDQPIDLDIAAELTDASETISSVTVSGLNGATLSAGTVNEDGSVTLTVEELAELQITPPANFSGDLELTVAATSRDGESEATTTTTLTVSVAGVADEPSLSVDDAEGNEDSPIPLNIEAALSDTDGSETLTVTISGVPAGASLSAGTPAGDGVFVLTAAELAGLTITPPTDSTADFVLGVSATSTEDDGDTETTSTFDLAVTVNGTASEATLIAGDAIGLEDAEAIPLEISVSNIESNDSLASIVITGVPANASISAGVKNQDGSYTLTLDDLDGLTISPPANSNDDFDLTVAVTTQDDDSGETSTVTETLTVSLTGVADAADLTAAPASGNEDNAIPLTISAELTDEDGSEEITEIRVSNIPNGAVLSAGTVDEESGDVILTSAELAGLTITPPVDFSGDITLSVTVTTQEDDGDTNTTTEDLTVSVTGIADAPELNVSDASGSEDQPIDLDISAALTDGSETLSGVTISGLNGATLNAGTVNQDGSVTLTAAQLVGLQITPPENFSGDLELTVAVTSTDGESENTTTETLTVSVAGVADAPNLAVIDAVGAEDQAIDLTIAASLTDASETLSSVTVSGLNGATLSAGTVNQDGSVTLTAAELVGLQLTPPENFSGDLDLTVSVTSTDGESESTTTETVTVSVAGVADAPDVSADDVSGTENTSIPLNLTAALVDTDGSETLTVVVTGLPAGAALSAGEVDEETGAVTLTAAELAGLTLTPALGSVQDFVLTVTATATEADGDTASTVETFSVTVDGVAGEANLVVSDADGAEDNAIPLTITVTGVNENDTAQVTIGNIPAGATLSTGTIVNGIAILTIAQLANLTITPPANSSDDFDLSVTVTTTDNESGQQKSISDVITVAVDGVADAPVLNVENASGSVNSPIALDIQSGLQDLDGSETLSISITGLPNGASLVDGEGVPVGTPGPGGTIVVSANQLDDLHVLPPQGSLDSISLTVTATATEADGDSAETVKVLTVDITGGTAGEAVVTVTNAAGAEDTAIPLSIVVSEIESDDTATITLSGIPTGAVLKDGSGTAISVTAGTATLLPADLAGLTITPPANSDENFTLTVTVLTEDNNSGEQATVTKSIDVDVSAVADAPTLELGNTAGNLAAQIPVDITSSLTDLDGSEELAVTISGLNGAVLSAGQVNDDGSVTLTAEELDGLTITPGPNSGSTINLTVAAIATDNGGDTASVTGTLTISVSDSSTVVLVPGQDLDLVAPASDIPEESQKLVLDASFGGVTTGDDWIIAQDEQGRVTITNTASGQLVTADGYEEIDIDFGPGQDTVELRNLSNTDLTNDTLTLNMGDGDDSVVASEDVNRDVEIYGGAGNDTLQGSTGSDLIDGGADDDVLTGAGGVDDLDGGEGSDTYLWSEGDGVDNYGDTGDTGTDTIVSQSATFDGFGDGFDADAAGIEAIGRDADGDGAVDSGSPLLIALSDSSETVDFSGLDFMNSQTTIDLGGGDDTVTTAAGDSDAVTYIGGEGQDTLNLLLTAESLNQMISAGQLALLQSYIATPDNTVLTLTSPNIVAQGFETVRIGILGNDGAVTDVTDTLSNATADNEGIGQVLLGTNEADLIFAGGGNDFVRSFGGNDALFGGDGEDFLSAGADDDYVDGGTGNDIIDGGSGNDRLIGGEGADLVSGGFGDDHISGGEGNDFLAGFEGDDIIEGDAGNDQLAGGNGQDTLIGGDGDDRLVGGNGNDLLIGGDGFDILEGENGDDVLISNGFEDQLFGGNGNDVLVSTMDDLPTSPVPSGAQGQFNGIRDGGSGEDTFRLDSANVGPHSLSGDEFSHIRNIETLDLSGVDELQLSLRVEDVVTMTDEDNDLTILLGENVTSIQIDEETIQLENGQAVFQQDGVQVILQQQQPPPEA